MGSITGMKRSTHKKGKFQSVQLAKSKAELTTISKARDLIRKLYLDEFQSVNEKENTITYLRVCFDRLLKLGLTSIPRSLESKELIQWSESTALADMEQIKQFIQTRKEDMVSKDKERKRKLFLDPKIRGRWLAEIFGGPTATCPRFVTDGKSGEKTQDQIQ